MIAFVRDARQETTRLIVNHQEWMHRGISAAFKGTDFPVRLSWIFAGFRGRGCATLISFSSNRWFIHHRRSFSPAKDSKSRVIDTRNCLTCLATGLFTPKLSSSVRRAGVAGIELPTNQMELPLLLPLSRQTRKAKLATSEVLMDILTG